jgi:hypothetical protein
VFGQQNEPSSFSGTVAKARASQSAFALSACLCRDQTKSYSTDIPRMMALAALHRPFEMTMHACRNWKKARDTFKLTEAESDRRAAFDAGCEFSTMSKKFEEAKKRTRHPEHFSAGVLHLKVFQASQAAITIAS